LRRDEANLGLHGRWGMVPYKHDHAAAPCRSVIALSESLMCLSEPIPNLHSGLASASLCSCRGLTPYWAGTLLSTFRQGAPCKFGSAANQSCRSVSNLSWQTSEPAEPPGRSYQLRTELASFSRRPWQRTYAAQTVVELKAALGLLIQLSHNSVADYKIERGSEFFDQVN
jgi:hypothetical protein